VRVHEVVERTAGSVTRCNLVDGSVARTQEIPVWMLDGKRHLGTTDAVD
jgi:hypothetical protein